MKNEESKNSLTVYSPKTQLIDPNDLDLQQMVLRAFWAKLQLNEIFSPKSLYRFLAIDVLELGRDKGFGIEQLESACKRFKTSQQFGDRIEVSKFFDNNTYELHPASWRSEQFHLNKSLLFDAYKVEGFDLPQWRIHDGKKLENLECVVWAGKSLLIPILPKSVQTDVQSPKQGGNQ